MSVRIRLARIGKKKAPFFRIVAIDKRAKRDGQFLENLGTYNPISGEMVQYHADKIQAWIEKGAQLSDTVIKLQRRHKKGQTGALTRVAPVKATTPSKAELEAKVAAEAPEPIKAEEGKVEAASVEKPADAQSEAKEVAKSDEGEKKSEE